jgi:hypothetical protein
VQEALQTRAPLEDLQALADQAAQLPVYVGDIDTVHSLLGKAQEWLRKANNLASQVRRVWRRMEGNREGWGEVRHRSGCARPTTSRLR